MTEKRFKVEKEIFDGNCIVDTVLGGYYTYDKQDLEKLCEVLNRLSHENWNLRRGIGEVYKIRENQSIRIKELSKENEQLKKRVMILQDKIKGLMK